MALERLGGLCVFAAEWKDHLRDLYLENHGLYPFGDITEIEPSDIPDHDVLTAGFPCQPFSKAGEQRGFECTKQGNLFFNVVEILRKKKPNFFILENVPNLLKHDGGRTWAEIQKLLGPDGLGYHVRAEKYSPHNFGIPQIRERVYIVGSLATLDRFEWPQRQDTVTNIDMVLDKYPVGAKQLTHQVQECLEVWDKFLKHCPPEVSLPSFPLWSMEWGATYPFEEETPYSRRHLFGHSGLTGFKGSHGKKLGLVRDLDAQWQALPSHARTAEMTFPKWKKDFIRNNRNFYEVNQAWIQPWLDEILKFPSSLQKLEWNVQGGERDIWQYVLQFRASGVRIKRKTTAPSLIAMTDTQVPIIAWERRYMTPLECARLQSLDNLKKLPSSTTKAFQALGNAVNSQVVQRVAQALLNGTSNPQKIAPKEAAKAVRATELETC